MTDSSRYFYRDPLAAAWMAKHHGFRFQALATDTKEPYWDIRFIGGQPYRLKPGDTDGFAVSQEQPYYVHPDSLPLLEPQDGDKDEDGYTYHAKLHWWLLSLIGPKGEKHVFNKGSNGKPAKRNGVVFHFPEREDA